jgi:hypothetical protein
MIADFHPLSTTNAQPRLHATSDNNEAAVGWTALLQELAEPLSTNATNTASTANATNAANAAGTANTVESVESVGSVESANPNSAIYAESPNFSAAREAVAHMVLTLGQSRLHRRVNWKRLVNSKNFKGASECGVQSSVRRIREVVQKSANGDPSQALLELSRNLGLSVNDLQRVFRLRAGAYRPAHLAPRPTIAKTSPLKPLAPNKGAKRSSNTEESDSELDELAIGVLGPPRAAQPRPGASAPRPCDISPFELPVAMSAVNFMLAPRASNSDSSGTGGFKPPFTLCGLDAFGEALSLRGSATFFGDLPTLMVATASPVHGGILDSITTGVMSLDYGSRNPDCLGQEEA